MKSFFKNPLFPFKEKSPRFRFFLALLPSLTLVLGHDFLPPVIKTTPAALHYPSVFLAAWLSGTLAGLVSITICFGFTLFIVRPHLLVLPVTDIPGVTRMSMFVGTSLIFLFMLHVLRKALRRAQDAVSLRDDFLNLVSHELKTPLTALKLNLDIVRRKQAETSPESGFTQIDASIRQVNRLERLITSMMDLTHYDSGQLSLMRRGCDLRKIVHDVVATFQNETIVCEMNSGTYTGSWDQIRIEQIVSNIVHNAIKYGQGKPIEVTIGSEANKVWFAVKDHGAGIDPKDQQRIFERFQRANSCTDVQGLGLGLYLTKKLVEIHEGEIQVISKPGEGSTFKVLLPA